jgi:hypothetical protein
MSHHCHARNCEVACKPEFLMCPRHWGMVPTAIKRAVLSAYRRGQCDDKKPSRKWFLAAEHAILAVAYKQGLVTKPAAIAYLQQFEENLPPTVLVETSGGAP